LAKLQELHSKIKKCFSKEEKLKINQFNIDDINVKFLNKIKNKILMKNPDLT